MASSTTSGTRSRRTTPHPMPDLNLTVPDYPYGAPCWVDLLVSDVDRAQSFYSDLFGWRWLAGDTATGGYTMALLDGHPVAGISRKPVGAPIASQWTTYLRVGADRGGRGGDQRPRRPHARTPGADRCAGPHPHRARPRRRLLRRLGAGRPAGQRSARRARLADVERAADPRLRPRPVLPARRSSATSSPTRRRTAGRAGPRPTPATATPPTASPRSTTSGLARSRRTGWRRSRRTTSSPPSPRRSTSARPSSRGPSTARTAWAPSSAALRERCSRSSSPTSTDRPFAQTRSFHITRHGSLPPSSCGSPPNLPRCCCRSPSPRRESNRLASAAPLDRLLGEAARPSRYAGRRAPGRPTRPAVQTAYRRGPDLWENARHGFPR